MRIALIQAPQNNSDRYLPLGLLSLASQIKEHGYQPIIIDFSLFPHKKKYRSDFFKKAAQRILRDDPQVLGFAILCNSLPTMLLIANECKKLAPKMPIIFGGPEVSFDDIEILERFKQIDIIVRNEGEITLVEVLEALKTQASPANILGITYRENKDVIRNEDRPFISNLDTLPSLNYSLLPFLERYDRGEIEGGRGCPFQCTFCSTCRMWKRSFRTKSPERLVKELKNAYYLFKKDENSFVCVEHDNFLVSKNNVEKFFSLMREENMPWACFSRLEILDDEDLIRKLHETGCQRIFIGVESGSPATQKRIKKNLPLSRLAPILEMLGKYKIRAALSFIIGFPFEDEKEIDLTLQAVLETKLHDFIPRVQISLFTLLKGSELFEEVKGRSKELSFMPDFSPLITNLPAEAKLIKSNPSLFPSFYSVKNNSIDQQTLRKNYILYNYLAEFFPLTTLFMLRYLTISPLQLGRKVIRFFDSKGIDWNSFWEEKKLHSYYYSFFKIFIEKHADLLAKEIFAHEKLFYESGYGDAPPPCLKTKITLNSLPMMGKGVIIRDFSYDISKLNEILKAHRRRKILKNRNYIAYVSGKISKAVFLDALSYHLLLLCSGNRSIQQIIQLCLSSSRPKNEEMIILEKFKFLHEQRVVSFNKPANE